MEAFIKKHEYNFIKKCLFDLGNAFKNCVDIKIIDATKGYLHEKILKLFTSLSEDEKEILDINKINYSTEIDTYLAELNEYVCEMPNISNAQISKLFKKEKKLKLPDINEENSKNVYLGWIDESGKKLFVAYNMKDKLTGMICKIPNSGSKHTHMCALCNYSGNDDEVAFVSAICKTNNTAEGSYKSIGFDMCLDSQKCNERIIDITKLEEILKNVNNIK